MKSFLCAVVAGSLALNAAFADQVEIAGTVVAVTPTVITVQKATEPGWVWEIKRGTGTNTTVSPRQVEVGSQATVNCNVPDAQKKESPSTNPTATPAGQ